MTLSQEHKELLQELVVSDQWPAILAACDVYLSVQGTQLLKKDFQSDRELSLAKARYEGAQALAQSLRSLKTSIREKRPSPK